MAQIAAAGGKGGDDLGVGQVLFLCRGGQGQVFTHQPDQQFARLGRQGVMAAETLHLDGTQGRVIATASLGNIVEKGCEIEEVGRIEIPHDAVCKGELVGEFGQGQTAQIAQ